MNFFLSICFVCEPETDDNLLVIDTNLNISTIKYKLRTYLWNHFISKFDPNNKINVAILFYALVLIVVNTLKHLTLTIFK